MNSKPTKEISPEEVKRALFLLNPDKAPGPDGMTAIFYQRFWDLTEPDLIKVVQNFHYSSFFNKRLYETNICLIPNVGVGSRTISSDPPVDCHVGLKSITRRSTDSIHEPKRIFGAKSSEDKRSVYQFRKQAMGRELEGLKRVQTGSK